MYEKPEKLALTVCGRVELNLNTVHVSVQHRLNVDCLQYYSNKEELHAFAPSAQPAVERLLLTYFAMQAIERFHYSRLG